LAIHIAPNRLNLCGKENTRIKYYSPNKIIDTRECLEKKNSKKLAKEKAKEQRKIQKAVNTMRNK
jgi:hypothetical protein